MKKKSKSPRCSVCGNEFVVYFSWNGTGKAGLVLLAHNEKDHHRCTRIVKVMDLGSYLDIDDYIKVKRGLACYLTGSENVLAKVS